MKWLEKIESWIWLIAIIVAKFLRNIFTDGHEYNMFIDGFSVMNILKDIALFAITYVPSYYLILLVIKKLKSKSL